MSIRPSQWHETPDLYGDRVTLAQLRSHHAPGVLAAADDDTAFERSGLSRPRDLTEAEKLVEEAIAATEAGTHAVWAQFDADSGEFAGTTAYYDIDPHRHSLAIGRTWSAKRFEGSGIDTEATLLLLTRAFDTLGAVRAVWHTEAGDETARTWLEEIGASFEGTLRKHRLRVDGTWTDTALFAMTDDDWPAAGSALRERVRDS